MLKTFSRNVIATLALICSAAAQPTITTLQNNYGNIQPGLPNYGIAPASLFVIYGTGLSDPGSPVLQSSAAPGLPTSLNHSSISVTVNGVTTAPGIYYTSPTQIAAVLPSTTPAGTGTITVTYNGVASSPATILVPKSAFGIDSLSGTGTGGIVATVGSSVILPTASASPGQVITIWGSGLGADTANDDKTYPLKQDNLNNAQVYVGGVLASVQYAGRSQYPGVDQVNAVVPSVSGCENSVVVIANGVSSNFGTLPVNPGGGVCSDPELGVNGSLLGQAGSQSTVRSGVLLLSQSTEPAVVSLLSKAKPEAQTFATSYLAAGIFESVTGLQYVGGSSFLSLGSCVVSQATTTSTISTIESNGLDAGTPITLTGGGLSAQLMEIATSGAGAGFYDASLSTALMGGAAYTFKGPGGTNVGPFTATVTFPVPLTWTNENSITSVTEALGQQITWTGGATGTYVEIVGSSTSSSTALQAPATASFVCLAPVSAQQLTIPSYVLLALPPGTGSLGVYSASAPVSFTASGLDYGSAVAVVISDETVTYQ